MQMRKIQIPGLILMIALSSAFMGCVQAPARVSTDITVCCEADFFRYKTYQVRITGAPGFLEPYLRQGLITVLDQKGLEVTIDTPDLMVDLVFDQVFLSPETAEQDYFGESVDPSVANRFMAAVAVDVIATATEQIVWSGRLSRIHPDAQGQPRGNDHKMQGIIDGFDALFADYPVRLTDTSNEF
jgi:hypothetical protein